MCFEGAEGYVDAAIHWRPDLRVGEVVEGPAVVEEYGATVPIHPGFTAVVDDHGNLLVRRG